MGLSFDKYVKIKELPNGLYNKNYKVQNKEDNKYYVINYIDLKYFDKNKLKDQAKLFSSINDSHVIKYYELSEGEKDKKDKSPLFIIVMEYCENSDLRKFIDFYKKNKNYINEYVLYFIILEICLGLKKLHQNNLIHLELKPENIFIDKDYKIKINGPSIYQCLNSRNSFINVTSYTPPEMAIKMKYNKKSDIWSLGCIIYELCTLNPCFEIQNNDDRISKDNILELSYNKNNLKNCNEKLKNLIESCLKKDYKERPDINKVYTIISNLLDETKISKNIDNTSLNILKGNKIKLVVDIKNEDINKQIYYLDNTKSHDKLKELNEYNTKLNINGLKVKFSKSLIFIREGSFNITLYFKKLLKDCSFMFYGCDNIISIDLSCFESHNVTNMDEMFCGCNNLSNLDLSNFDTTNVTTMKNMFFMCDSLSNIDLSYFNTSNVTNMSNMFFWCTNLTNLNLADFKTHNVVDMSGMFFGCKGLTNLNLSNFDTEKVIYMNGMFSKCINLESINLSNFGKNATDMSDMFSYCKNLSKIGDFKPSKFTDKNNMFDGCDKLVHNF